IALQPRGRAPEADPRPTPRVVHVVRECDGERPVCEAELLAQALKGRIERIEPRPLGAEAAVLVPRPVALFDPREMEEAGGELVLRKLTPPNQLPGLRVVRDIVAEADLRRADRVEHPARAAFDLRGYHVTALRTTRARCTSAGFGSSTA